MNPAIRKPNETQEQYRKRLRKERAESKEGRERLLWDSAHRGTYVRAKHGPLRPR